MPDRAATAVQKTPPVLVRAGNGALYEVQTDDKLTEASDFIKGLLRDRRQWRNVEAAREGIVDYCIEYMKQMGLSGREELARLGRAGLVQVEIDINSGLAARGLAWEFVISEATRRFRTVRAPLVVRRLIRTQGSVVTGYQPNANPVMFVRSSPAGLRLRSASAGR